MDLAVILAGAGEGRRMGGSGPKLLLDLRGRSLLERVARTFLSCPAVGEIVAVVPEALLEPARECLAGLQGAGAPAGPSVAGAPEGPAAEAPAPVRVVAGGATRQESVRLGLEALTRGLPFVAVHDVARALVSAPLIEHVLDAARAAGAAIPALPVRDTLKEVAAGRVVRTVPREALQGAQTPQIFARDILARAHQCAVDARLEGTDDASLAEAIGVAVAVVPGDPANLKLTEPSDWIVLQALLDAGLGGSDA